LIEECRIELHRNSGPSPNRRVAIRPRRWAVWIVPPLRQQRGGPFEIFGNNAATKKTYTAQSAHHLEQNVLNLTSGTAIPTRRYIRSATLTNLLVDS
jgi:hypothetical protein